MSALNRPMSLLVSDELADNADTARTAVACVARTITIHPETHTHNAICTYSACIMRSPLGITIVT
jgi:hypothetical protein